MSGGKKVAQTETALLAWASDTKEVVRKISDNTNTIGICSVRTD